MFNCGLTFPIGFFEGADSQQKEVSICFGNEQTNKGCFWCSIIDIDDVQFKTSPTEYFVT